ncbi:MAG: hypothetical protein WDO69_23900 [Pseudomonadota bacterium]
MDDSEIAEPIKALALAGTSWEEAPRQHAKQRRRATEHKAQSHYDLSTGLDISMDRYAARLFDDPEYVWPRKARAAEEEPVAVILRGFPAPINWGWFSREDQRMHLQTVNKENQGPHQYKAWLEDRGAWTVVWENRPPGAKDARAVERAIEEHRSQIQSLWAAFMIDKSWLTAHISGQSIVLVAYPQTAGKFERTIDLSAELPNMATYPAPDDIGLDAENASVVVWKHRPESKQHHFPLAGLLWR